jgi:hypothetical protein
MVHCPVSRAVTTSLPLFDIQCVVGFVCCSVAAGTKELAFGMDVWALR